VQGYCTREQLGHFILDLPTGKSANETSFWSALLQLPATQSSTVRSLGYPLGVWDNPAGVNPHSPISQYDSPGRRETQYLSRQASDILHYKGPIHYPVTKTGFYCVGKDVLYHLRISPIYHIPLISRYPCDCLAPSRYPS
jgi:hypothetical protein